jgi:hypothetical protein
VHSDLLLARIADLPVDKDLRDHLARILRGVFAAL